MARKAGVDGMTETRSTIETIWTLPNILTITRIVLIPLFLILLLDGMHSEALGVFALGGLTDAFDGAIARRTKQKTVLGSYLDPLADKLLIMSSYVTLAALGFLPVWLAVLVLSRDFVIILGYGVIFVAVQQKMEVRPSRLGKLNTVLQIVTVLLILLELSGAPLRRALIFFYVLTAATTVASGLHYIHQGMLWFQHRTASP